MLFFLYNESMKTLNDDIQKAIEYSLKLHSEQLRKGGDVPYAQHPVSIAMMMCEEDLAVEIIITALLHDLIEDTIMTYQTLRSEFGETIERYVKACSEPDQSIKWEIRKQATIDKFPKQCMDVKWVILGDKLHNLFSIYKHYLIYGDKTWSYFSRGYDKQKWYYESLKSLFIKENQFKESKMLQNYCQIFTSLFEG